MEQTSTDDPLLGRVLHGRFEIIEPISQGAQGRIYKAKQLRLDRIVALKVLNSKRIPDEQLKERFFLEASLSARLNHPHIVQVLDYGSTEDQIYYFAMEFIDGQTLEQLLRASKRLPPPRALELVKQICSALIEAHENGFIHRDLKLKNVLVTQDEFEKDFVKLLDFGIVKDLSTPDNLTQEGQIIGSPRYMAPEQILGQKQDGRTDLYALGGILHTLLCGQPPFLNKDLMATLKDQVLSPVPSLNEINPYINVPAELQEVVQRALKKSKENRYPDARTMYQALQACEQVLEKRAAGADINPPDGPKTTSALPPSKDTTLSLIPQPARDFRAVSGALGPALPAPIPTAVERALQLDLRGLVAFTDLNCPFCYALHERLKTWGLADRFEWRLVEHASHVLDGPFGLEQESILSQEVVAVHHWAPDVPLLLPPKRMRSSEPNSLLVYVQRLHPEKLHAFRSTLYRALWTHGLDIGEKAVLRTLLEEHGLDANLVELTSDKPFELEVWQEEWEQGDFNRCIPVLSHQPSGNVLIGLPSEQNLLDFLLGERTMLVDSAVCHYQRKPIVVICGWISHLWQLVQDLRHCCELIQAATVEEATEAMFSSGQPDLLIIEREHVDAQGIKDLAQVARKRSIYWALATNHPDAGNEVEMLSLGSAEYLPLTGGAEVARARLARVLRARFNLEQLQRQALIDNVTGLPSRRQFVERLDSEWERGAAAGLPISLILLGLDNFNAYNAEAGYLSGDTFLHNIAAALLKEVHRPGDLLARFSGDEFAVLMPSAEDDTTAALAERLASAANEVLNNKAPNQSSLAMKIGYATIIPTQHASIHDLYESAAKATT
jgi:diguanylate cyclase (GGDEF)-like protein